jgi:hypothetical protein
MKAALLALAVLAAFASPVKANDLSDNAVAVARKLDGLCRGMSGDHVDDICEARDRAFKVAEGLGYCYGKQDQIGADHRWHKCTRNSNRVRGNKQ